jgi:hypothetical protein
MTPSELAFIVNCLKAHSSNPSEFKEAMRSWLLKKTNELSREFNT